MKYKKKYLDSVRSIDLGNPIKMAGLDDDKKLEKKLRKHGIDPDRMLETAKKLIKAQERKLLREAKPKYKQ
jgi:hypothetical protein